MGAGDQRCRQGHREGPLVLVEVPVARGQGETVGLADDGDAADLDVDVQVAHHLVDEDQLLVVLLPEVGRGGCDDAEQLRDHRQHPGEMAGPRGAFEFGTERTGVHRRPRTVRVHVLHTRDEGQFHPGCAQHVQVGVEGARVRVEILPAPNCSGLTKIDTTTTAPLRFAISTSWT